MNINGLFVFTQNPVDLFSPKSEETNASSGNDRSAARFDKFGSVFVREESTSKIMFTSSLSISTLRLEVRSSSAGSFR
jgi:hypothetical protein